MATQVVPVSSKSHSSLTSCWDPKGPGAPPVPRPTGLGPHRATLSCRWSKPRRPDFDHHPEVVAMPVIAPKARTAAAAPTGGMCPHDRHEVAAAMAAMDAAEAA